MKEMFYCSWTNQTGIYCIKNIAVATKETLPIIIFMFLLILFYVFFLIKYG